MILIVGPGAIGGVLAARWAEAGVTVRLLGRTAPKEALLVRRGIVFTGTSGRKRAVRAGLLSARREGRAPCAAVFFCVKSHDTPAAIRAARPWIGPQTAVIGLQNGIGHEALLRRAFGPKRTVIGSCYVAADRPAPFHATHNGGKGIHLAVNRENAGAFSVAASWLRRGGWKVAVQRSEDAMLWTKLCFNASGNALGALCGARNSELVRDPALRAICVATMREAVAAAKSGGHRLLYPGMERLIVKTYPNDSRQRNSMLQDLASGRRTEADAILGPLLAAGRRRGVPTPILRRLWRVVRRLEPR